MQWRALSSRGLVRADNEDSWTVEEIESGTWLGLVADGIGGNEGGELASSLAAQHCAEYVKVHRGRQLDGDLLRRAFEYANLKVFEASSENQSVSGMGTTLTCALVQESKGCVYVGHVGDSRAYLIGSDGVRQITEDHSLTGELLRNGSITEEDAMTHPAKNVLTMALGPRESLAVAVYKEKVSPGDAVLLCTDGLTTLVSSAEIWSAFQEKPRQEVASFLVDMAIARGGYDNVTVVLMWSGVVSD